MSECRHGSMSENVEAVRIRLLGGFSVSVGARTVAKNEWRLRRASTLVKMLALSPGQRLHREQVMDILWPELGKKAASNNLRQTVRAARRAFDPVTGSRYLASEDEQLVLCPTCDLRVDIDAFEESAAIARRSRDPAAYRAAMDLYAGELLPGDRYEEWAEVRRQELRRTFLTLLVGLAELYQERREYRLAVDTLQKVVAEDPINEEAQAGL